MLKTKVADLTKRTLIIPVFQEMAASDLRSSNDQHERDASLEKGDADYLESANTPQIIPHEDDPLVRTSSLME
jgi:hypothetical protein